MIASRCPDRVELLAYHRGEMDEDAALRLTEHLGTCTACQETLHGVAPSEDTLIERLRRPTQLDPFAMEPERLQLIQRVKAIGGTVIAGTLDMASPSAAGRQSADLMVGAELGEYQLQEKLGQGGMGAVYSATHTRLKRTVAVKLLPRGRTGDSQALARFEREMEAVGRLSHPNIVQAHDAREIEGTHFLVMEYVEGQDLSHLVRRLGPLPIAEACEIVRQAAVGLQYAHDNGLVHRDIKPSNLMVTRDGHVKILDLGLARLQEEQPAGREMTAAGQVMGTAEYMAPEQVLDSHSAGAPADQYSLGCTMYKLLTGEPPFPNADHKSPFQTMMAHTQHAVPSVTAARPDVPQPLADILGRMLAKAPERRFAGMAEVASALEPFTTGSQLAQLVSQAATDQASPAELKRSRTDQFRSSAQVSTMSPEKIEPRLTSPRLGGHGRWRSFIAAGVLLGLIGTLAAWQIVIRIKKGDRETAVEVPAGSTVKVGADGSVDVTLPDDGKQIEAGVAKRWPPGPAEDVLPGLIPRPAKLPGIKRWQVESVVPQKIDHIDWSPDSKFLACASYRQVRIYEVPSLKLARIFPRHKDAVGALAWSPDGKWLAVAAGSVIHLWDPNSGTAGPVLPGNVEQTVIWSMAWAPDGKQLVAGGVWPRGPMMIWDVEGDPVRTSQEAIEVAVLSWSPDGKCIVGRLQNGVLQRWNAQDGELQGELDSLGPAWARPIAFSPDGKWLAAFKDAGSNDRRLKFWSTATWEVGHEFEFKSGICHSLSWSPRGDQIVAGHWGGWIYDLDGKVLCKIEYPDGYLTLARWSPSGKWIAFAERGFGGQGFRLWDAETQGTAPMAFSRSQEVSCLDFSPDGDLIVSASNDCTVRIIDRDGGQQKQVLHGHKLHACSVAWSPSGDRIASGSYEGVRLWDLSTGGNRVLSDKHLQRVVFGPDGKSLAAAGQGKVVIWDTDQAKPRLSFEPTYGAAWIRWTPDAKWIAAGNWNEAQKTQFWDSMNGDPGTEIDAPSSDAALSPDGERIAVVTGIHRDGTLKVFDTKTGLLDRQLANSSCRYGVAWSPDGKIVLACGTSPDIELWHPDGSKLPPLRGHSEDVRAVAFHPKDSRLLVSGGNDASIRLWDLQTGQQLWSTILLPDDKFATFDPAGNLLSGNAPELDDELVYVVERDDGSVELLKPSEFRRRLAPGK